MKYRITIQFANLPPQYIEDALSVAVDPNTRVLIVTQQGNVGMFFPLEHLQYWMKEEVKVTA